MTPEDVYGRRRRRSVAVRTLGPGQPIRRYVYRVDPGRRGGGGQSWVKYLFLDLKKKCIFYFSLFVRDEQRYNINVATNMRTVLMKRFVLVAKSYAR